MVGGIVGWGGGRVAVDVRGSGIARVVPECEGNTGVQVPRLPGGTDHMVARGEGPGPLTGGCPGRMALILAFMH